MIRLGGVGGNTFQESRRIDGEGHWVYLSIYLFEDRTKGNFAVLNFPLIPNLKSLVYPEFLRKGMRKSDHYHLFKVFNR